MPRVGRPLRMLMPVTSAISPLRIGAAEVLAALGRGALSAAVGLEGGRTVVPAPLEVGYGLTALIRVPQLMSGARVCPQVGSAW